MGATMEARPENDIGPAIVRLSLNTGTIMESVVGRSMGGSPYFRAAAL